MSDAEYEEVITHLSSFISKHTRGDGTQWKTANDYMGRYLQALGLQHELPRLSVIHVAGTKGKGSTCAMVESILRQCGYKTGLFTSPHLVDVRERIRINGEPVDRSTFIEDFWWCQRRLKELSEKEDVAKAAYFRFMTLLGLRIFLQENVDVAILEVGLGGRLDATNCVPSPVVTGISSLGFDHMEILGYTLPEIAREKAGIFKPGVPALTVQQPADAHAALQEVADAVKVPLTVVPDFESYSTLNSEDSVQLGVAGVHQQINASLAVQLAACWEQRAASRMPSQQDAAVRRAGEAQQGRLPGQYVQGLNTCVWPGRSQVVSDHHADGTLDFFLDGAHTAESMACCADWFAGASGNRQDALRLLLFNCMKERDPKRLLEPMAQTLALRDIVLDQTVFVPPDSSYTALSAQQLPADLSLQLQLQSVWDTQLQAPCRLEQDISGQLRPPALARLGSRSVVMPSLRSTLDWLRACSKATPRRPLQVLVTGSLYLVGDMLRLLGDPPQPEKAK